MFDQAVQRYCIARSAGFRASGQMTIINRLFSGFTMISASAHGLEVRFPHGASGISHSLRTYRHPSRRHRWLWVCGLYASHEVGGTSMKNINSTLRFSCGCRHPITTSWRLRCRLRRAHGLPDAMRELPRLLRSRISLPVPEAPLAEQSDLEPPRR